MNEMQRTMSHVPNPHRLHQTRVPTDSYHTMSKLMRDKIHHSWITFDDHFTKQISFVFQTKRFLDVTQESFIFKIMCLFIGSEFPGSHRRLRKPPTFSRAFIIGHICITKTNRVFTRGGVYPYFLIPNTYFHFSFPF